MSNPNPIYKHASKIITTALLIMVASVLSGATNGNGTRLVAHAGSLSPQSPTPSQPAYVTEHVSSGTSNQTPVIGDSVASDAISPGVIPGSNCVACVEAITGRGQNGNAGTWVASHSNPRVGDIMIFRPFQQGAGAAGHVGVVAWTDGYHVKLRHCHWAGGQVDFVSTGLFF